METGETMDFCKLQLCSTIFVVLLLTWLPDATAADDPFRCHEQGPCSQNWPGPGSMDMNNNENLTFEDFHGRMGALWHCAENFTTFKWYKLINNTHVPFPWGRESGLELCDSNQTIIIRSLQMRDTGTYIYKASNGTADVWGFINYEVACKPGRSQLITKEQPEQYITLGAQKTLHCAAYFGNCDYHSDGAVMWYVQTSHGQQHLTANTTNRFITCNTGGFNGQSCNLTFSKVSEDDFGVKYICLLIIPEESLSSDNQYSVVFIKLDTLKKSWLFIIIGTALGCALVSGITVFIVRHHGERIKFWLRRQPERRYWKHDVVLIRDEDHECLVENYIKPQLTKEGYRICVMRPGHPAILEQTSGIVSAYSVIFSFSPHEIHGADSHMLAELAASAKQKHSRRNVVVIRKDEEQGIDHSQTSSAEQRQIQTSAGCQIKNAWKDLKHLTWPKLEISEESDQPFHSIQLDKFWSSLHKHLPRTNQSVNMTVESSQREIMTSCSSTNSRRHLLSTCSQESTHYSHDPEDFGTFTNGIKGKDLEEEIDYNQKITLLQTTSLTYPINMPSKKRFREYQNISKNVLEEPCKQTEPEEKEDEEESTEDEQDEDVPAAVTDYRNSTPETVQVAHPSVNQTLTPSPSTYSSCSPLGAQVILTRIPEDGTVTQTPDSSFPIFSDFRCLYSEQLSEESVASAQCHQDSTLSSLENSFSSTGTGQGTTASQSVFKYIPTQLIDSASNPSALSSKLGNTLKSLTNCRPAVLWDQKMYAHPT
ncbi:uncharacterized protein LOC112555198 isoform X2 [Pomacea canaliculata]|uniref:uncharacterized protein LOC112555198 isoform X2 n=1 Tax=Pomacea canaliculata TaxID=400727 RepID=UPI000D73FB49|nr:uncharacterized protein LOC112555198 isoform X2 [Pomacea canaliculata]